MAPQKVSCHHYRDVLQEGHVIILDLAEDESRRLAGRDVCSNRCNNLACPLASTGDADEVVQNHQHLVNVKESEQVVQQNLTATRRRIARRA